MPLAAPLLGRGVPFAAVGLALLLGSGCTATLDAARPSVTDPSTLTGEPTADPPTTAPAAADGSDLTACADGSCEIRIDGPTDIPVDPGSPVVSLRVESIGADEVAVTITFRLSSASVRCTGGCSVSTIGSSAGAGATSHVTARAGGRVVANGVGLDVVTIEGGSAVLRLAPA